MHAQVNLDLDPGPAKDGSSFWSLWNNSEAEQGTHVGSQGAWLERDLAAAAANLGLGRTVASYHRSST